jgi:hypothetical protein
MLRLRHGCHHAVGGVPPLQAWCTSLVAVPPSVTACLAPHALLGDGTPWSRFWTSAGTDAPGSSNRAGPVKATEEPATMVRASAATALTGPVGEAGHAMEASATPGVDLPARRAVPSALRGPTSLC